MNYFDKLSTDECIIFYIRYHLVPIFYFFVAHGDNHLHCILILIEIMTRGTWYAYVTTLITILRSTR